MKPLLTAMLFLASASSAFTQNSLSQQAAEIEAEGKKLYRLEAASWYGTDLFLEKFPEKKTQFSGYFSYNDGALSRCLFYSKGESPKVLATLSFDSSYNLRTATADGTEREFTATEKDVYSLRQQAVTQIENDTLFKSYQNTNFNVVPLIDGGQRKVYVLTGTSQHGVVMFGNDYLLVYNEANELQSKRRLHKGLIPTNYGKESGKDGSMPFGAVHTHLPEMGELMTATDVCTLLLYQHLTNWNQHLVISENYVSIWDCRRQKLLAFTTEAWKKINKDQR